MAESARPAADDSVTIWEAQPGPQTALIACPVFEIFFGGARGGGKTDGVLGDFLEHADSYGEHAIGLMVRRQRTELIETIERSKAIYTPLGWTYHEQDKMWRAPNGARLRFAYLERDADADGYQGHSYSRLYVEEAGTFPSPVPIFKLMATLRSGAGVPVGFRATGNPGGPGHQWVKARYIDPAPMGWKVLSDPETGLERVYIPSRVQDNQYLGSDYVQRLKASGSPQLVAAWLGGDWSVIDGAFFPEFSTQKHVLAPFSIPADWLRFRAADWGSAAPFCIQWWAVAGDDYVLEQSASAGRVIPRGSLVCYREWYGGSAPNVGLKLPAEDVADGIKAREAVDGPIKYGVLDPAAFASDGGPSIAERMSSRGVHFGRADNARISQRGAMGGWDQMRSRLRGREDKPLIYWFSTCTDSIRTIPAMQHDRNRPEDIDSDSDDHAADTGRYACMSRPYIPRAKEDNKPADLIYEVKDGRLVANMSVMDIVQAKMRKKRLEN